MRRRSTTCAEHSDRCIRYTTARRRLPDRIVLFFNGRRSVVAVLTVLGLGAAIGALFGSKPLSVRERALVGRAVTLTLALDTSRPPGMTPFDLVNGGIQRMVESLDTHSTLYSPERTRIENEDRCGSWFQGIGVRLEKHDGSVTIVDVLRGEPADLRGLQVGDVIIGTDGINTTRASLNRVIDLLRDPSSKPVEVVVRRPGRPAPLHLEIARTPLKIPDSSVPYRAMVGPDVGYIRLAEFTREAHNSLGWSIDRLKDQGMQRLILDLRGNGGGDYLAALSIASIFLEKGTVRVTDVGREDATVKRVKRRDSRFDGPLAVLVDQNSASASELVAGVLQDHDRAVIVGSWTWGKGTVLTGYPIDEVELRLVTHRFYLPSGRCVERDSTDYIDYILHRTPPTPGPSRERIFRTEGGRTVLGGQGLIPEVIEFNPEKSEIVSVLKQDHVFFDVAIAFLQGIPNDREAAWARRLVPTDEAVDFLYGWAERRGSYDPGNLEDLLLDPEVRTEATRTLKVTILDLAAGTDAAMEWRRQFDEPFLKALKTVETLEHPVTSPARRVDDPTPWWFQYFPDESRLG